MNPRETTDKICSDYKEYITSILEVKNVNITKLAKEEVYKTEFVKGPFLETTMPFEEGKSLKDLAEEGLISKEFEKMGKGVHYDEWNLRIHQEAALRHIIQKERNMIVSTGTGSGKTECYLYPVFDSIMREKEQGTLTDGVRALLIFPMNALANDQQKKLRKILKHYPDITFGRYTGETHHKFEKETVEQAEQRMHKEYDDNHMLDSEEDLRKSIPNEYMCREKMIENPPHILLTNYAMLEYLLLQPNTAPFFDDDTAKNWKFIVIDEAHTYKGATGTEIAFLLRRLKERISHKNNGNFRCIATSATLGSEDAKADLANFAKNLFDEPFAEEDIITTKRIKRVPPSDARLFMPQDYINLKNETDGKEEFERGSILFDILSKDLRLFDVYKVLDSKPKTVNNVADFVFDDIENKDERLSALINLIELAAAAKKSEFESALLPARYHLFVKSLEGMFVQYRPNLKVYLDRKESVQVEDNYYPVFELANCQRCGQEYIVGKTETIGNQCYLKQTSNNDKPEYYFISDLEKDSLELMDEDDSVEETEKMSDLAKYHLCLSCGRITDISEKHSLNCCDDDNPSKIVTVFNLKYSGKGNESNCCPCCGATRKGLIKRFLTANQPATFAVAKSLYDAIPPRPIKKVKPENDIFEDDIFEDIFDENEDKSSEKIIDESGRKLLIFSDNRQEAAFFAGFFEKKYRLIMWRKAIISCLNDADDNTLRMDDLIMRVKVYAEKNGLYSDDISTKTSMTDDQMLAMAAHYVTQEFLNPDTLTGLEGLGYINIFPDIPQIKKSLIDGMEINDFKNTLIYMFDTLRQKGVVTYHDSIKATDDFFAPRNHVGYFRQQNSKKGKEYIFGFIPQESTPNKRLNILKKVSRELGVPEEDVDSLSRINLKKIYDVLMQLTNSIVVTSVASFGEGTVYSLNYKKWFFKLIKPEDKIYKCNKCGRLSSYSIMGLCKEMKCDGKLEEVCAAEVQNTPYYSKLYKDSKLIPMVAKEHTAQLSTKTAGDYQKDFEEGRINVLSCSTTFEMGVDVGELEATFQRNVPPETANYIQRAGRAGRRTSSAAFSVTFSRRTSHDMTFFHDPTQIIAGKMSPPILEVTNEKIAHRHLNSIVVSWFFKKYPEYFEEKTKAVIEKNMSLQLKQLLEDHPQDLLDSIHASIPEDICDSIDVDNWMFVDDIVGEEGTLTRAIETRNRDVSALKELTSNIDPTDTKGHYRAIAANKLIKTLVDEQSISFLSANGVLPKYGFPIDSVSLDILSGDVEEAKKIDLSRDLKMAISEFAPPAQVVANGKVWTSWAINTVPNKSWPTYVYYVCPHCNKILPPDSPMVDVTIDINEVEKRHCLNCGTLMNAKKFIIPLFGFSTKSDDIPKMVGETKPSSYYLTQTQFWGVDERSEKEKAASMERVYDLYSKQIGLTYSPGGQLFVLNRGSNNRGLLVCPSCGFATDPALVSKKGKHFTKYGGECGSKLIEVTLGHKFSTDVLKIVLPKYSIILPNISTFEYKSQDESVLYAIIEGACYSLGISRDDINGCIDSEGNIILYDDTPGGSGFVKQVYLNFEKVLRAAYNKVDGKCGCSEETSCYGCLRTYSNQFYHDELSRGLAKEYLKWLLNPNAQVEKIINQEHISQENAEQLGKRTLKLYPVDIESVDDTITALESIMKSSDNIEVCNALNRLISSIDSFEYEHPIINNCLPADIEIWPEVFWPKSKVALFAPSEDKQYDSLAKYDWYCYYLNDEMNSDVVLSHIRKVGE